MRRVIRWLKIIIPALIVSALVGTALLAWQAYRVFTTVQTDCSADVSAFTPANFHHETVVTSRYLMPDYETVRIPARDSDVMLSGFYIPTNTDTEQAPTVIVVHGLSACKREPRSLLPAGMLHQQGFNILVIDLRDMGESDLEDGRHSAGTREYLDVLGAWDWLISEKHIPAEQIGLYGYSLGGSSVLIAMGQEQQVAAAWADSAFADVDLLAADVAQNAGVLQWMKPLVFIAGRVVYGENLLALSPLDTIRNLDGRALLIVHGDADDVIPVSHAHTLADNATDNGQVIETWITSDSEHVDSIFDYTDDYETRLLAFFTAHLTS